MKQRPAARRLRAKREGDPRTVDDYLSRVPEPARGTLMKVRRAIRSALPEEAEEIISYRMPAFRHGRIVVWFAAFSDHCSLFPTAAVIEELGDELEGYAISKGTIRFPPDRPPPAALVRKIVKARLAGLEGKKRR